MLGTGAELAGPMQPQGFHVLPDDSPPLYKTTQLTGHPGSGCLAPCDRICHQVTSTMEEICTGILARLYPFNFQALASPLKEPLGPGEHLETGALCLRPVDRVVRPAAFVSSETPTQKGSEAPVVLRSWLSNDL